MTMATEETRALIADLRGWDEEDFPHSIISRFRAAADALEARQVDEVALAEVLLEAGKGKYETPLFEERGAARLARAVIEFLGERHEPEPIDCAAHKPVQHRDGKPPWCKECGLDAAGNAPKSRLGEIHEPDASRIYCVRCGKDWPCEKPVAPQPSESDVRGRLARTLFIASDDFAFADRMAKAWDAPGPHGRQRWYNYADAILAAFPILSRDIAGEIEAERHDMGDGVGDVYYAQGLQRAAEIVRNGR